MPVRHIDHLLTTMPAGREDEARAFYHGMLGFTEKAKPPKLVERFACRNEILLDTEVDLKRAAAAAGLKAHPAFIVDGLRDMVKKLMQSGYTVTEDEPLAGCDRRHVYDPFGNRIELIEPHAG